MMPKPIVSHEDKSQFAPHLDCLNLKNAVVALVMLTPATMMLHGHKSCVTPHFDHLNLRVVMVPLMMLKATHYASIEDTQC